MPQYSASLQKVVHGILLKYPQILDYIREQRYRNADTELTYRQINSLDDAKLLNGIRDSKKDWRSFNLNDLLYLHIISNARLFNSNYDRLKYLKIMFYKTIFNYSKVKESVTVSEIALIALLTEFIPVGLIFFTDGDVSLTDDPETPFSRGFFDAKHRAFVYIMLYETFKPYLDKLKLDSTFKDQFDFSEFEDDYSLRPIKRQERKVLNLLDKEEYTKLIFTKKADGKLLVEGEKIKDCSKLTSKDMFELLGNLAYGGFEGSSEEGKMQSLKLRDKYKI